MALSRQDQAWCEHFPTLQSRAQDTTGTGAGPQCRKRHIQDPHLQKQCPIARLSTPQSLARTRGRAQPEHGFVTETC